ncbi:MAG: nitroreductase [Phycisphaerales bacterium]
MTHHPNARPSDPLGFLRARRSASPALLSAPAPGASQLAEMLRLAARTPDHGMLVPYRFIVLDHAACRRLAWAVGGAFAEDYLDAPPDAIAKSRHRFESAPMIVAVVCRARPEDPRKPKIPEFEQLMTCGAVCMNLLHAAHAMGFGAVWLTGWTASDERVLRAAGLEPDERLAGWIHIGTQTEPREDRDRPDLSAIISRPPGAPMPEVRVPRRGAGARRPEGAGPPDPGDSRDSA